MPMPGRLCLKSLFLLIFPFFLGGCPKEPELCGNADKPNCCSIGYKAPNGGQSYVSYCVKDCANECKGSSGGVPNCPNKVINTDQTGGCKTGEKSGNIFKLKDDLAPFTPRVMRVQFSNDPLDCSAVCKGGDVAFCQGAVPAGDRGAQLSEFERRVHATVSGTIPMSDVHRIFNINSADDPCDRGGFKVSAGGIESTGSSECLINTSVALGAKDVGMTIHVPKVLKGKFRLRSATTLAVNFDDLNTSGTIELDDAGLNLQWGGQVQSVSVLDGVAYFGLPSACLKVPLQ